MAAHARLKIEFTEGDKCHNLMSWLILCKKHCPEAANSAMNERMNRVEEAVGRLVNDVSNMKTKLNELKAETVE